MTFNFADARTVLAGTVYGEASGIGRAGMENVAQCVLNRVADGWNTGGVTGVCLAYEQFSCWNFNTPDRDRILAAEAAGTEPAWTLALTVADAALAGTNPDRILGADSYFAHSIAPPYWAHPPAVRRYSDGWHDYWRVKPVRTVPVAPTETTDDLNAESAAGTLDLSQGA